MFDDMIYLTTDTEAESRSLLLGLADLAAADQALGLIYGGEHLPRDKLVQDLGLDDHSTLWLVSGLDGGTRHAPPGGRDRRGRHHSAPPCRAMAAPGELALRLRCARTSGSTAGPGPLARG